MSPDARPPLKAHFTAARPPPSDRDFEAAALVAQAVAFAFGLSALEIVGATRARAEVARARQVAIYLAHTVLGWPLHRVAAAFGRDRTTAGYACARIEDSRDDPVFDAALEVLERWLGDAPEPRSLS